MIFSLYVIIVLLIDVSILPSDIKLTYCPREKVVPGLDELMPFQYLHIKVINVSYVYVYL